MLTAVGWISVTAIGSLSIANSMRSESVNPFTACFDAEYMPCSGITASGTSLPTLIDTPALSIQVSVRPSA